MKKFVGLFTLSLIFGLTSVSCCPNQEKEEIHYKDNTGVNRYFVSFDSSGGTPVKSITTNEIKDMPLSTRDGYILAGWYLDSESSLISFPYIINKNQELHASWTKVDNKYNVSFITNGGSGVTSLKNVSQIEASPITIKEHYSFIGWCLDVDLEHQISFPYQLSEDITLYAKWEVNQSVPQGVLLVTAKTGAMEAKSYWSFVYQENNIQIQAEITDEYIYGYDLNPGLNDNVEIIISPKFTENASGWNKDTAHHFLVDVNGGYYYQKAKNESSWDSATELPLGVSLNATLSNVEIDGYYGYKALFTIPYSIFNLSKKDAINNLSMTVAMRNTNAKTASTWETSFHSDYNSMWSYYTLNEDGTFKTSDVDIKTLIVGGDNFSIENWSNINMLFKDKKAYSFTEEIIVDDWNEKTPYLLAYSEQKVIINVGRYDYHLGKLSNQELADKISFFIDSFLSKHEPNDIYVTSIEPLKNYSSRLSNLNSLNNLISNKCATEGITYLDTYSLFLDDKGKLDTTMFASNFAFSKKGFDVYWDYLQGYIS